MTIGILLFLVTSSKIFASDLIYLNGFENTALVSGSASGITSTGLELKLISNNFDETLQIVSDGTFVFSLSIEVGNNWSVSTVTLPDSPKQSCTLSNETGVMTATGDNNLIVNCNNTPWQWDTMNWDEGGWQ
ncbi:MAG: hypothetical protein AB8B80_16060 [Marinicellaceae bacterium]